jgi:transcriptional regulator with XRE-family HTH domain
MVDMDEVVKDLPSETALFPAYRTPPQVAGCITVKFQNPADPYSRAGGPLDWFQITAPLHSSFDAEWPIPVDVPLALRGFRHALGLSQAKFADRIGQSRLNIERWETGKSRPFRGHTLSLLSLLRPLAQGPLAAGQLLNFAAAVVCPRLTRPAATYRGHEIARLLADGHLDHADLAPALLEALVSSEVLVPLDDVNEDLNMRYVPLVGVRILDREIEPWEQELLAVARRLDPNDRNLWLTLGKRFERVSTSPSAAGERDVR